MSAKPPRSGPARATQGATTRRKLDHIQACLDDGVDLQRDSFAAWKLRYCALPELALEEVSTAAEFAGKPIAAPLIISSMTGGAGEAFRRINGNLARAAEALQIPLGLGSMKVMLSEPEAEASFRVRELAPTAPIISNLGLVSFNHGLGPEAVARVQEVARPDVFGLHLNALQEVVQDGGDTDFRGLYARLEAILHQCRLPVYVKECGGGIAPEIVARLASLGVAYVDVSGSDGTSWAAVEARLSADPALGERFRDFGLPTAWILERLPQPPGLARIVASGGIRNGLQAAKALALGAQYVSVARPFLAAALESAEAAIALGERFVRELRTALLLTGCRSPAELGRQHLIRLDAPGPGGAVESGRQSG
jgi:isopentenyl-diphosphate Delta-isomerase